MTAVNIYIYIQRTLTMIIEERSMQVEINRTISLNNRNQPTLLVEPGCLS